MLFAERRLCDWTERHMENRRIPCMANWDWKATAEVWSSADWCTCSQVGLSGMCTLWTIAEAVAECCTMYCSNSVHFPFSFLSGPYSHPWSVKYLGQEIILHSLVSLITEHKNLSVTSAFTCITLMLKGLHRNQYPSGDFFLGLRRLTVPHRTCVVLTTWFLLCVSYVYI